MNFIITESIARKFFGDEDPIGKIIVWERDLNFKITGVVKDPPDNSHIKFDFLGSILLLQAIENCRIELPNRWKNDLL